MAVPKSQISTQKQAYDYAIGSAQSAAAGVCPSTAAEYQALAAKVSSGAYGTDASSSSAFAGATAFEPALFLADLGQVDGRCRMSADYKPATTGSGGTKLVDPGTGGAVPPDVTIKKAGFPWWAVLLLGGGALVYYLSTKKKSSSTPSAPRSRAKRKRKKAKKVSKTKRYRVRGSRRRKR